VTASCAFRLNDKLPNVAPPGAPGKSLGTLASFERCSFRLGFANRENCPRQAIGAQISCRGIAFNDTARAACGAQADAGSRGVFAELADATGSGIFVAAVISGLIMGFTPWRMAHVYWMTIVRVRFSLLTIAAMLSIGYLTRYSGSQRCAGCWRLWWESW
jgi:hypothetical protein